MQSTSVNGEPAKRTIRHGRHQRGQGLVEYALIIVFVSIVVIVAVVGVAAAVNRGFGLVAGALGAKHDVRIGNYMYWDAGYPQCGKFNGQLQIYGQFYIYTTTGIPMSALTVSSDIAGLNLSFEPNSPAPPSYDINTVLPAGMSCPHSIVVQSDATHGGITLVQPVVLQDFP